jgi:DNA-binding GntR family transcriptional regulator
MTGTRPNRRTPAGPPAPLPRVKPYDRLKEAILSGALAPGQPLVEASLAQWCQVSRTPVREALRMLEHDGLVTRGERGLVVREMTVDETLDIYQTRISLEMLAAHMAAERRTEHDLMVMRGAAARMTAMGAADPAEMVRLNERFHQAIWSASRNTSLIDLLARLHLHLGRYSETGLLYPGRWDSSNVEHDQLVAAITDRDATAASEAALRHFNHARDIRLALLEETTTVNGGDRARG